MDVEGKTSNVFKNYLLSSSMQSLSTDSNNSSFNNYDFNKVVLNELNNKQNIENNMKSIKSQIENDFGEKNKDIHLPFYKDPNLLLYKSLDGVSYKKLRVVFKGIERDAYLCFNCLKCVLTFEAIKYHINTHRNVRPYVCVKCNRAFHTRHSQRRHKCEKNIQNVGLIASNNSTSYNSYSILQKEIQNKIKAKSDGEYNKENI